MVFFNGVQDVLVSCGAEGCLFLCYLYALSVHNHVVEFFSAIQTLKEKNIIRDDFYVNDGLALLKELSGTTWEILDITDPDKIDAFVPAAGDTVLKGYGITKTVGHWDTDTFHPKTNSRNVQFGKVRRLLVCREVI